MSVDKKVEYIILSDKNKKCNGTYRGCLINELIALDNVSGWETCDGCEYTALSYNDNGECINYGCIIANFTAIKNDLERFTTHFKNILK